MLPALKRQGIIPNLVLAVMTQLITKNHTQKNNHKACD